ncbi:MAG: hypothetical protein KatS3mg019_1292 [Fimbriimonadales bacterium]|nr:MAG: hypothetical protein KatS3mg019_1292 [Fimbriimonadales bacterium]
MYDSYPDYDACSEDDHLFSYEGEYADLLRDAEWDYEYCEGEWEYYADLDRECYDW